jgi:hypothetical protein
MPYTVADFAAGKPLPAAPAQYAVGQPASVPIPSTAAPGSTTLPGGRVIPPPAGPGQPVTLPGGRTIIDSPALDAWSIAHHGGEDPGINPYAATIPASLIAQGQENNLWQTQNQLSAMQEASKQYGPTVASDYLWAQAPSGAWSMYSGAMGPSGQTPLFTSTPEAFPTTVPTAEQQTAATNALNSFMAVSDLPNRVADAQSKVFSLQNDLSNMMASSEPASLKAQDVATAQANLAAGKRALAELQAKSNTGQTPAQPAAPAPASTTSAAGTMRPVTPTIAPSLMNKVRPIPPTTAPSLGPRSIPIPAGAGLGNSPAPTIGPNGQVTTPFVTPPGVNSFLDNPGGINVGTPAAPAQIAGYNPFFSGSMNAPLAQGGVLGLPPATGSGQPSIPSVGAPFRPARANPGASPTSGSPVDPNALSAALGLTNPYSQGGGGMSSPLGWNWGG